MDEILLALGYQCTRWYKLCLVVAFVAVTFTCLLVGDLVNLLGINQVILQIIIWTGWFTWLRYYFIWDRNRYLSDNPATAYSKVFYRDILPGVSIGVSQMVRPAWRCATTTSLLVSLQYQFLVAVVLSLLGVTLLYLGFRAIGIANAGFLGEFQEVSPPMIQRSIYAYIRHPLFLGGVLASLGVTLLFRSEVGFLMGGVNLLILPVYSRLEDKRLTYVFGEIYQQYKDEVGGIIPKRSVWWLLSGTRSQSENRRHDQASKKHSRA